MTKPFYLTSEFWISVATVATSLSGALPGSGTIHSIIATAVVIAYAISRGLAKSGTALAPVSFDPALDSFNGPDIGPGVTPLGPPPPNPGVVVANVATVPLEGPALEEIITYIQNHPEAVDALRQRLGGSI